MIFPAGIFRGSVRDEIGSRRRGRCGGGWSETWEADSAGRFRRVRGVAMISYECGRGFMCGRSKEAAEM